MNMMHWRIVGLSGLTAALSGCGDNGGGTGTLGGDPTGPALTTGAPETTTSTGEPSPTTGDETSTTTTGATTTPTTGAVDSETGSSTTSETGGACGGCPPNFICKYDQCLPDLGTCRTYDDCPGDSYCDADGVCIPYDVPAGVINDPECKKPAIPEGITPVMQCEWNGVADPKDKTANSKRIYSTPIVADLNLDKDPLKLQPSVIVTTHEGNAQLGPIGTLRVFDGRTCTEQMRAGGADAPDDGDRPAYAMTWTVGDLDDDVKDGGHPEIVGYRRVTHPMSNGPVNIYAMRVNSDGPDPVLERAWYGRACPDDTPLEFGSASTLVSPMLHDVDDDAFPEVIVGENVFDHDGCLLTEWKPNLVGVMPVIADVDLDDVVDLVDHHRTASWDPITSEWVDRPYFVPDPAQLIGFVSVANLGLYSQIDGVDPAQTPEVAVLSVTAGTGRLRIQALDGKTVWGPVEIYAEAGDEIGKGGTVTISDFDGDGQVEMATAGATTYAVYDPDCVAALMGQSPPERPGGTCERSPAQQAKNLPDGVLWAQPSKDASSNVTGSSIFDFDGDGQAEAVYRDECYLRVYNGRTGEVVFSASASSGTGSEYPAVADVDGDFATEIVVPRTNSSNCPAVDPIFPASGPFKSQNGFIIYRDPMDRWANSRPVWNQHPYFVTHITDDARVPRASETPNNWQVPNLNNFRQNSQGSIGQLNIADLTVELTDLGKLCRHEAGAIDIQAEVCNRGTNPVQDGVLVQFLETAELDQPVDEAKVVCEVTTTKLLQPGQCEVVLCPAELTGGGNVYVNCDPEQKIADCHPGNNLGADALELCPG